MIERQLVVPVPAERLWDALTDPAVLDEWFGSSVSWELRPGGPAHFDGHDGVRRQGLVTEVLPGRRLSFRWWEEGGESSEVSYHLEPDPEGNGTRLVVTEHKVEPAGTEPAASVHRPDSTTVSWSDWDDRLVGAWALTCTHAAIGGRR